jgi:hypothetical protein
MSLMPATSFQLSCESSAAPSCESADEVLDQTKGPVRVALACPVELADANCTHLAN